MYICADNIYVVVVRVVCFDACMYITKKNMYIFAAEYVLAGLAFCCVCIWVAGGWQMK